MTSRHDLAITAAAEAIKALGYPDGFDPMLAAKASVEAYDAAMPDPEAADTTEISLDFTWPQGIYDFGTRPGATTTTVRLLAALMTAMGSSRSARVSEGQAMPKHNPTAVELVTKAYVRMKGAPPDVRMIAALRELQRQLKGRLGARLASSYIGAAIDEHELRTKESE